MAGLIDRLTNRYPDSAYVIKLKAQFLLRVCLAGLVIIPAGILYTGYVHLNNPAYGYTINLDSIAPLIAAFIAFVFITLLLVRGRYAVAAHGFFIVSISLILGIMLIDKSSPIGRLDTVVVLIAILSMSPLVINRHPAFIAAYSASTILLVGLFLMTHASEMTLTYSELVDVIADTSMAIVVTAVISYNLFSINRLALTHSEESRAALERANEELNAANEELQSSNEEIEASMEELTATNEEFEAQNRELLESQEIISEALEEKTVLIKEIHHRVKNNMQIVSSLLNLQAQSIEDPRIRQPITDAVSRIHSMALIHEKIYRADNFTKINMAAYLSDLTDEIIQLYSQSPDEIQVVSRLEPIHLCVDQAIPCGILINEILTNSIKHGCRYPSNCSIELAMSSFDGRVTLIIADSGPGIEKEILANGSRKTMGMQIIEALAQQLNADLAVDVENGTRFTIQFTERAV